VARGGSQDRSISILGVLLMQVRALSRETDYDTIYHLQRIKLDAVAAWLLREEIRLGEAAGHAA